MRRFAVCAGLVAFIVLGMGWLLAPTLNWDGAVPRKVQLTVLDAATSAPIAGASVDFSGRNVGTTDATGSCEWLGIFPAGGTSGLLGRSGNWLIYGELKIIGADGRSRTARLDELVKESRRSLRDDDPIKLSVSLAAPATSRAIN